MSKPHRIQNHTIGVLQIAFANVFIGLNIICSKYLLNSINTIVLLELRYFFACLIFLPIIFHLKKNRVTFYADEKKFSDNEKILYILMAISGGALFNAIYMAGIRYTTAIATGIISSIIPLLIILLSFVFFKQKIQKKHIVSAIFVSVGIGILNISLANSDSSNAQSAYFGNFIVLLAMFPEAMFTIFAKMIKTKVNPTISAYYINFINLIACTPFFLFTLTNFDWYQMTGLNLALSFLVGLSGVFFYYFYNSGISKISAQTVGILTGVTPLSTALMSVLFLKESFNTLTFAGMGFVLVSIYLGIRKNI